MVTNRLEAMADSATPGLLALQARQHVLDLDDFSQGEIEVVLNTADSLREVMEREIKKVPALRGKSVITLFYEPSTRTRGSFEQAAKILSADVINLTASASSVAKGESLLNTARTLQAMGADVIIIRHPSAGAPYLLAQHLDASIINAGDGSHAHPTQALLDLYTIRQKQGGISGKKVVLVGDILYSRVARSNIWGLTVMGAQVVLCGPPTLLPSTSSFLEAAEGSGPPYPLPRVAIETDLDKAIEGADVVMALRLQSERQQGGLIPSLREYARLYQVNEERLKRAKPNALVLHPGPMIEGVEISSEVAHGHQSVIEMQVTNGVAVRIALLYLLATGPRERRGR